jgi:hypothetical protein
VHPLKAMLQFGPIVIFLRHRHSPEKWKRRLLPICLVSADFLGRVMNVGIG